MRAVLVIAVFGALGSAVRADEATEDAAYKGIMAMTTLVPRDEKSDDCKVSGSVDFDKFSANLPVFRDAFLNRDFSIDFYNQRRKQVLSYVLLKRAAELITEGLYNGHNQPECHFSLSVSYPDKYGQDRHFEALTWRFDEAQSEKVNWAKFDPRDFNEVALDYELKPAVTTWTADEPAMVEATVPAPEKECDMTLFNANALFVRSSTFCRVDFMDSKAGLIALEGARKCAAAEPNLKAKLGDAMRSMDRMVKEFGRAHACSAVAEVAKEIQERRSQ